MPPPPCTAPPTSHHPLPGCSARSYAAIHLNVVLTSKLASAPLVVGSYTLSDQKCADIAYLRESPHAAARCGIGIAGMSSDQLLESVLGADTCAGPQQAPPPSQAQQGLPGGVGVDAIVVEGGGLQEGGDSGGADGGEGPRAGADCHAGGGKLGALLSFTKCTTRIDGTGFTSYEQWRAETAPANHFNVSNKLGVWLPNCAFLGSPTSDGLGGFMVDGPDGARVPMYCDYQASTASLPYKMEAKFHCEAPLYFPDATVGVSHFGGLADVRREAACDDANCLRCIRHYEACLSDSQAGEQANKRASAAAEAAGELTTEAALATLESLVRPMLEPSFMRSTLVGAVIGAMNFLLPAIAGWLTAMQRPISRTAMQKTLMLMTFAMLAGHSLGSLFMLNRDAFGRLGFYTTVANQVGAARRAPRPPRLPTCPPRVVAASAWALPS